VELCPLYPSYQSGSTHPQWCSCAITQQTAFTHFPITSSSPSYHTDKRALFQSIQSIIMLSDKNNLWNSPVLTGVCALLVGLFAAMAGDCVKLDREVASTDPASNVTKGILNFIKYPPLLRPQPRTLQRRSESSTSSTTSTSVVEGRPSGYSCTMPGSLSRTSALRRLPG